MKLTLSFSLSLLLLLFTAIHSNAEIKVRVENGQTVFYNTPSIPQRALQSPVVPASNKHSDFILEVSRQHGVDPELVNAVIVVESGFNSAAVSPKGAVGLMQLMPGTAQRFGVSNSYDPQENIRGGVQYLKFLLDLFQQNHELAVAAYNAGEGAVQRFHGIPRYPETQQYVKKVLALYGKEGSGSEAPRTYYRYTDSKGVTHYSTTPPPEKTDDGVVEMSI